MNTCIQAQTHTHTYIPHQETCEIPVGVLISIVRYFYEFVFFKFILNYLSVCVCTWVQGPTEAKGLSLIPWSWSYKWLWAAWCGSSAGANVLLIAEAFLQHTAFLNVSSCVCVCVCVCMYACVCCFSLAHVIMEPSKFKIWKVSL